METIIDFSKDFEETDFFDVENSAALGFSNCCNGDDIG